MTPSQRQHHSTSKSIGRPPIPAIGPGRDGIKFGGLPGMASISPAPGWLSSTARSLLRASGEPLERPTHLRGVLDGGVERVRASAEFGSITGGCLVSIATDKREDAVTINAVAAQVLPLTPHVSRSGSRATEVYQDHQFSGQAAPARPRPRASATLWVDLESSVATRTTDRAPGPA